MERIMRISTLLLILFVVQGWSRPNTDSENDYPEDEDISEDDYGPLEPNTEDSQYSAEPPKILSQPMTITVVLGDTIVLPCVMKGADAVDVSWTRNSELLYINDNSFSTEQSRIIKGDDTLVIHNATASDASENYVCKLSTIPVTEIVHRVFVVPEITLTPSKHTVAKYGEDVELGCKFNRYPNMDIKWSYKGERLPIGDESVHGNIIKIHKVTRHHAGRYQCLINDHTKTPLHDFIELVVNYPPEVQVEQEAVHTGMGKDSQLTCIVHAHPHANVTWFKNKKHIDPKDRIFMKNNGSKHTLVLKRTTNDDFATYTCQASNALGTTSRNVTLTGVPTKARFSGGEVANDTTLILKWQLQSFSPITEYKLQYRRKGESSWIDETPRVIDGKGAGETLYTVEHPLKELESGVYEAILIAKNDYGWSAKEPVTFSGATGSASSRLVLGFTLLLVVTSYISLTNL
ncbi:opioid-binding protein/cell adhesion molecule homolog isoform X2 [Cephus cinctus]|uniref:Opioid-binding protein/cell adhesion molecule homolog isoform X2 n=1 Tax=Cephus cinctus TaxID=211228 RepID=A0AAJ7C7I4_CEPCN|nr:opioid-binding protein/cell adhesion molecule homolog isoform X2 [Cephus cinctus]XP_024944786.1 opioid-binding protein/cell adhesion molecule homolog isoform X2 [Cephus cinctus]